MGFRLGHSLVFPILLAVLVTGVPGASGAGEKDNLNPKCLYGELSDILRIVRPSRSEEFQEVEEELYSKFKKASGMHRLGAIDHLKRAARSVLHQYEQAGLEPPIILDRQEKRTYEIAGREDLEIERAWQAWSESFPGPIRHYGQTEPLQLTDMGRGSGGSVFELILGTEKKYFRLIVPDNDYSSDVVRKTWAAAELNRSLGLNTVPHASFASVRGLVTRKWNVKKKFNSPRPLVGQGVLSDESKGIKPPEVYNREYLQAQNIQETSLSNTMAFEFLIGNTDVHGDNFVINPAHGLEVFDHDTAFQWRLRLDAHLLGSLPPERYTRGFIENLSRMTPERIRTQFKHALTPLEIDALLFRRDLMLEDASHRGAAAFLP